METYEFYPREGYLLVEHLPSETSKIRKTASGFQLPDDFESEQDKTSHCAVKWIRGKYEGAFKGKLLIVERSMVEEIKFQNETYHVVHTRHVIGELFAC